MTQSRDDVNNARMVYRTSTRTNAQTSRQGWRPARTSNAKLVKDITASIKAKHAAGKEAKATDYTSSPAIAVLVNATLRATQPPEVQALRRQQQAHLDKGKTTETPDWSRPCDACNEPTTHGLMCSECEDMRWSWHYDQEAEYHEYMKHFYC